MREIPLCGRNARGLLVLVDDEDYDELSSTSWGGQITPNTVYARRYIPAHRSHTGEQQVLLMHRQILRLVPRDGLTADHISGNGLDNRRANLRIGDQGLNMQNQRPQKGKTSPYRGVSWDKRRGVWGAYAYLGGKHIYIGRFGDELEAARAVRDWRLEHYPFTVEVEIP